MGPGALRPEAEPWQPGRCQPPPAPRPPSRRLRGAWSRPRLPRSPGAGPAQGSPEVAEKDASAEGTALALPAAAGAGAGPITTTPPSPDGREGPSGLPTPQRRLAQLIQYPLLAPRGPAFAPAAPLPGCSPPTSCIPTHVPSTRLNSIWTLRLRSRVPSSRKPSRLCGSHSS